MVEEIIRGKCWVFMDNIDTDQIIQGQYLTLLDYKEMAQHTFEVPRPGFAENVKIGDIVVAGRNFGGGSSREEAPMVIKELGIRCVIAESFARIFYRNAFNIGLPVMIVPDITKSVREEDVLEVHLLEGYLTIERIGERMRGERLPPLMLEILRAGGAIEWYKQSSNQ